MLKETDAEETIGFFVTFLSMVVFELGGGRPPPLATPVLCTDSKQTKFFTIQRNKISVIFLCLQAKLLLFRDYRALRNFLSVVQDS